MKKVVITSDSTCDLTQELKEQYDIYTLPLYITINGKTYKDGEEINTDEMYSIIDKTKQFPKTSCPSVYDFIQFFKPFISSGCDVIYTGISSTMSNAYNNALLAKEEVDTDDAKVYVVDSGNLSTGIALLLLKACGLRDQGLDAKEISKEMEELVPRIRAQFVVEQLDYIYKGGRCSMVTKFIGNALKLRLQIRVIEKNMKVIKKTIGAMWRGVSKMVQDFIDNFSKIDKENIFITHTRSDVNRDKILNQIKPLSSQIKNTYVTTAGCVISSHCGPGCIGILYIKNE